MDNNFANLEERVLKAVGLIQDLRTENSRLQKQASEWESRFVALEETNGDLERELADARQNSAVVEDFEQKRRVIDEKVGGLLEKLDQIG